MMSLGNAKSQQEDEKKGPEKLQVMTGEEGGVNLIKHSLEGDTQKVQKEEWRQEEKPRSLTWLLEAEVC